MIAALGRKELRLLWLGVPISLLGDGIFLVAMAWQAYDISRSPSDLAYVLIAIALPQVLFLVVPPLDRAPERSVLVVADLARAAPIGLLALVLAIGSAHLWELCLMGFLVGAAAPFSSSAFYALLRQLVPKRELADLTALDQLARPAALRFAGPLLGGLAVLAVGPAPCFGIGAASWAFCAWSVSRLKAVPLAAASPGASRATAANTGPSARAGDPLLEGAGGGPSPVLDLSEAPPAPELREELREGFEYVRRSPWSLAAFGASTLTYFLVAGPAQVLLPYVVRYVLHASVAALGAVLALGGLGALGGAKLASQARALGTNTTWAHLCWVATSLGVAGYGIATSSLGLALLALLLNCAEAVGAAAWSALRQSRMAGHELALVSRGERCISVVVAPLSYGFTALSAAVVGARGTLLGAGLLGAAGAAALLFVPGARAGWQPVEAPPSSDDILPAPEPRPQGAGRLLSREGLGIGRGLRRRSD